MARDENHPAADELQKLIDRLREERTQHEQSIKKIDEMFRSFGIETASSSSSGATSTGTGKRRGRPRKDASAEAGTPTKKTRGKGKGKSKNGRKRRRGNFSQTAEDSILTFIRDHGQPNAKEVNGHWQAEGRGGKADNTLSKMVKAGQLERVEVEGERGGRYKAA